MKRLLWTPIRLLRACESNDRFVLDIIPHRLIYGDEMRLDCQQILELNAGRANEAAQSDLKYIYPETPTRNTTCTQNLQQQSHRNLLIKTCDCFLDYGQSFHSFQNQLKARKMTGFDILKPTVAVRKLKYIFSPTKWIYIFYKYMLKFDFFFPPSVFT